MQARVRGQKLSLRISSIAQSILECEIWADAKNPKALVIEELELRIPLRRDDARLNVSQDQKGLPTNVFRYARNQVFEFAEVGGIECLKAQGSQNFTVLMLYHKLVGMEPASPMVRETLAML